MSFVIGPNRYSRVLSGELQIHRIQQTLKIPPAAFIIEAGFSLKACHLNRCQAPIIFLAPMSACSK